MQQKTSLFDFLIRVPADSPFAKLNFAAEEKKIMLDGSDEAVVKLHSLLRRGQ